MKEYKAEILVKVDETKMKTLFVKTFDARLYGYLDEVMELILDSEVLQYKLKVEEVKNKNTLFSPESMKRQDLLEKIDDYQDLLELGKVVIQIQKENIKTLDEKLSTYKKVIESAKADGLDMDYYFNEAKGGGQHEA